MNTYPIMMRLEGRLAVVIGAGSVGRRKARSLADAGAEVLLVDPQTPAETIEGVRHIAASYEPAQLSGAKVVFACTDDTDLNARIAADARAAGAIANAVDQPLDCDFYSAAVLRDGPVAIAIGTGGTAPALVHMLMHRLQRVLPVHLGDFAEAISAIRERLSRQEPDTVTRQRVLKLVAGEDGYAAFLDGGVEGLHRLAGTSENED